LRFSDDFAYLDTSRWSRGDHMLGRSYLDPANVAVDGENLRIKLPARTLEGAISSPITSTATAPTPPG
jgi:endo-1,3-1,4-beta-glycanase ExoK